MPKGGTSGVRPACEGDPINFFDTNNPTDPHPAPGFATVNHGDNCIDCTVDLATGQETRESVNDPRVHPETNYLIYWEPRDLPLEG